MAISKFPIVWGQPRSNSFAEQLSLTDHSPEVLTFIHTGDVDSAYGGEAYIDEDVIGTDTISAVSFKASIIANATTGNVRCGVGYNALADAESFNPGALTNATQQTIAVPGTAYLRKDISFTLTAGDFAKDDIVIVEFERFASNTTEDTLAANLHLLKTAWIEVTHA